jgi:D123
MNTNLLFQSYRSITPKARIIPLTPAFLDYLHEDGIVLPDDNAENNPQWSDGDSGIYSQDRDAEEDDDDDALLDPSVHFLDLHIHIKSIIAELGGRVAPKLNWSAPKDATWMTANSMACRTPSDIYLLLKSSDFITHDLEHAFDDCIDDPSPTETVPKTLADVPYTLILRKYLELNPSLEFRCFVRDRTLIGITQRDLNHYDFLFPMVDQFRTLIQDFFASNLRSTFPDPSFVFDVYIPPPHKRVWLIDINPWAYRTDPLLFSWLELLQLELSPQVQEEGGLGEGNGEEGGDSTVTRLQFTPELRLVKRDDPEAYGFMTPQYSAHKLPREVVDASLGGAGPLREFADRWKEMLEQAQQEQGDSENEENEA